jgi:hypothetical protein
MKAFPKMKRKRVPTMTLTYREHFRERRKVKTQLLLRKRRQGRQAKRPFRMRRKVQNRRYLRLNPRKKRLSKKQKEYPRHPKEQK